MMNRFLGVLGGKTAQERNTAAQARMKNMIGKLKGVSKDKINAEDNLKSAEQGNEPSEKENQEKKDSENEDEEVSLKKDVDIKAGMDQRVLDQSKSIS